MGKEQSWDNAWDVGAMSNYNTITSLSESPKQEGLLYVGTDDGLIQVSENGGNSWRKKEVGSIKGVPATAFVNDIRADLFDANVVYAALDNHKYGDYKPYLLKSPDKGKSWRLITGDLPETLLVWRLVQDHINSDLLFIATEFGVYFTIDGGQKWIKLKGGVPTISFRDLTIQRRENDLVCASFGRGFYILDDYSSLRDIRKEALEQEALLFETRKAFWYTELDELYGQGHAEYTAENPPYGANFTYYLKENLPSLKELRQEKEKKLSKDNKDLSFPSWDELEAEIRQEEPAIFLSIKDKTGKTIRQIKGKNAKGFNRVAWDLSTASKDIVRLDASRRFSGGGIKALPGTYTVTLSKLVDGQWTDLAGPKEFEVVPLEKGTLEGASYEEIAAFRQKYEAYQQDMSLVRIEFNKAVKKLDALKQALSRADEQPTDLIGKLHQTKTRLNTLDQQLNGYLSKREVGERNDPGPGAGFVGSAGLRTTYGPTGTHKNALDRSTKVLAKLKTELSEMVNTELPALEEAVGKTGAPMLEGQGLRN